ncbi:unnamed protein product, partial [Mesorhabditis spiculigera]
MAEENGLASPKHDEDDEPSTSNVHPDPMMASPSSTNDPTPLAEVDIFPYKKQRPERPGETRSEQGSSSTKHDSREEDLLEEDPDGIGPTFPPTDQFGFIRKSEQIDNYRPTIKMSKLHQRERKWIEMLENWHHYMDEKYDKIKSRCRKGIPPALRGRVWKYLSGAKFQMEVSNNKLVFEYLLRQPGEEKYIDEINKDLNRQFPEHELFAAEGKYAQGGKEDLFELLKAWTVLHPEEGYCQGQAPIASVLLMHMPLRDAFYCFVQICHKYLPGYYSPGLEAVQVDGDLLNQLLKDKAKTCYRHLKEQNVSPVLYMIEWFMCIYCRSLPWPTVLRIWDMFLCEGMKVLLKVALVLLHGSFGNRQACKSAPDMHSILVRLKNLPRTLTDEETLVKKADFGVILGVYLPTIQHILGVTRFIRLFWAVGIAGRTDIPDGSLCCCCTFLTCISISAIATNGVMESGGAYYLISRNLGPEFGSAVGILFYLANTVATSMYLVGGIEILLLYIFPNLAIGGRDVHHDTGTWGMLTHNLRLDSTILLLNEFAIVAMGVKFVQLLAPVSDSHLCHLLNLFCYAGGVEKTLNPSAGHYVCMRNDRLLQSDVVLPPGAAFVDMCLYYNKSYMNLLNLASQLKAGRGLSIVASFIRGNPFSVDDSKRTNEISARMEADMGNLRLRGFSKAIIYGEDQIIGLMCTLVQSIGLGGLKPDTMLISWPTHDRGEHELAGSECQTLTDKLHAAVAMEMALLIDVYWIVQVGGLCILMAYLLKLNKIWRGCKLRIATAQESDNNTRMQQDLQKYVYQLRIDTKILIAELADPQISKNAFERTLLMEERTIFIHKMQQQRSIQRGEGQYFSLLVVAEHQQAREKVNSKGTISSSEADAETEDSGEAEKKHDDENEAVPALNDHDKKQDVKKKKVCALNRDKVHKMHTAIRLNELITEPSKEDSQRVLLNLPPPIGREGLDDYIHYLEVLSDNLPRVIFVRGTGKEVLTPGS